MTSFDELINRCARKLEKDADLFSYYNVSSTEAETLLREQIVGYLYDAIDYLTSKCVPDVDMYNFDTETQTFGFDLTPREVGLMSDIMRLIYYERQEALLGAFKMRMSPADINVITPSTERSTFLNLVKDIRHEVDIEISFYASHDRSTGKPLEIVHSQFDYEN